MKTRLTLASLCILLLAFFSCSIGKFAKEVEFELTFDVNGSRSEINVSYLLNAREYSTDFDQYIDNIENMEIRDITCQLSHFNGNSDQTIKNGLLSIADEAGNGETVLATLGEENLEQLYLTEKELQLEPEGVNRVEELILKDPNICLGVFTADVNEIPSDFTITFHIKAIIKGSLF